MKADRVQVREFAADDVAARDDVLRQHAGLVHQIVERLGGSAARQNGSFDDLVSAGMVGLLSAFDGFDAKRGAAFSTYAFPRVRGAVLDELRKLDDAPRSVRRKTRAVSRARASIEARTGEGSSSREVAAEMGMDLETFWRWELDSAGGTVESLDAAVSHHAAATDAIDGWAGSSVGADSMLELQEEADMVRSALARLPDQERLVLILYFYENLKLRQIGEVVGVSESRVSQIRTRALSRLREELAAAA
jgi:RNA polymerase sigma factor for flagellar operon FliA